MDNEKIMRYMAIALPVTMRKTSDMEKEMLSEEKMPAL
jgi:hypothetical protein